MRFVGEAGAGGYKQLDGLRLLRRDLHDKEATRDALQRALLGCHGFTVDRALDAVRSYSSRVITIPCHVSALEPSSAVDQL